MFRGIFVTGTDTNVGKTVVSAALMIRYRDEAPLRYWKPIQTGIERDDDSAEVTRLARCGAQEIFNCGVRLPGAVSPDLAARRSGTHISVHQLVDLLREADVILRPFDRLKVVPSDVEGRHAQRDPEQRGVKVPPATPRWIVEGAGGVFAPLNHRESMLDLMVALGMPVLVVARSTLGTINHTRLTVETLRQRKLRVAGVAMVGPADEENRVAIEWHAAAEVIVQMPVLDPLVPEALAQWVAQDFDRNGVLFGCLR